MLKLTIRNLVKNALDNLAGEKLFADTNKGKLVLRAASYEDELVYLVIELHKKGKLIWSEDRSGRYVIKYAEYSGLKMEVHCDLAKKVLVITLDKDHYVLSYSPLVDVLAHIIWHGLGTPHAHLSLRSGDMRNYYDEQEKVAEKVMGILKSK